MYGLFVDQVVLVWFLVYQVEIIVQVDFDYDWGVVLLVFVGQQIGSGCQCVVIICLDIVLIVVILVIGLFEIGGWDELYLFYCIGLGFCQLFVGGVIFVNYFGDSDQLSFGLVLMVFFLGQCCQ